MKFETKWKWFKRAIRVIAVTSGVLGGIGIWREDLALFVASCALFFSGGACQILVSFFDAFMEASR
uniref:Uncharacterized protein n=1 Tax=viral metagenome TaxID=1070528 RepID=A0A6M3LXK6_9ZZZZ